MIPFRKLFTFTKPEVSDAFQYARTHKYGPGFKLLVAPTRASHGKLLIIIPRVAGKAHDRNRIRRQAKSIFYEEKLYDIPVTWILLVRKQAIGISFEKFKQFLLHAVNEYA